MTEKKLYYVTVGYEYACLAASEDEAARLHREASDDCEPGIFATEVRPQRGPPCYPEGWEGNYLVYGAGNGDVTVEAAWQAALEREKRRAAEAEFARRQVSMPFEESDEK